MISSHFVQTFIHEVPGADLLWIGSEKEGTGSTGRC